MMLAVRQLRALGSLVLRSWLRQGPQVRQGRAEPTRGPQAILMRLVFVALMINAGMMPSRVVGLHAQPEIAATWAGLASALFAAAFGFSIELPLPRARGLLLKSTLLELLPLRPIASLALVLAQTFFVAVTCVALGWSLRAELTPGYGGASGAVLGLTLFVASVLLGACLGKLLTLRLPPYWASRAGWLNMVMIGGAAIMFQLSVRPSFASAPTLALPLGRALIGQDAVWTVTGGLGLLSLLAGAAFVRMQRVTELAEPVRPGATPSAFVVVPTCSRSRGC